MQRHTKTFEAELGGQSKFFETEEVFINVLGKVTADELIAAILECARAVLSYIVTQSRTLFMLAK